MEGERFSYIHALNGGKKEDIVEVIKKAKDFHDDTVVNDGRKAMTDIVGDKKRRGNFPAFEKLPQRVVMETRLSAAKEKARQACLALSGFSNSPGLQEPFERSQKELAILRGEISTMRETDWGASDGPVREHKSFADTESTSVLIEFNAFDRASRTPLLRHPYIFVADTRDSELKEGNIFGQDYKTDASTLLKLIRLAHDPKEILSDLLVDDRREAKENFYSCYENIVEDLKKHDELGKGTAHPFAWLNESWDGIGKSALKVSRIHTVTENTYQNDVYVDSGRKYEVSFSSGTVMLKRNKPEHNPKRIARINKDFSNLQLQTSHYQLMVKTTIPDQARASKPLEHEFTWTIYPYRPRSCFVSHFSYRSRDIQLHEISDKVFEAGDEQDQYMDQYNFRAFYDTSTLSKKKDEIGLWEVHAELSFMSPQMKRLHSYEEYSYDKHVGYMFTSQYQTVLASSIKLKEHSTLQDTNHDFLTFYTVFQWTNEMLPRAVREGRALAEESASFQRMGEKIAELEAEFLSLGEPISNAWMVAIPILDFDDTLPENASNENETSYVITSESETTALIFNNLNDVRMRQINQDIYHKERNLIRTHFENSNAYFNPEDLKRRNGGPKPRLYPLLKRALKSMGKYDDSSIHKAHEFPGLFFRFLHAVMKDQAKQIDDSDNIGLAALRDWSNFWIDQQDILEVHGHERDERFSQYDEQKETWKFPNDDDDEIISMAVNLAEDWRKREQNIHKEMMLLRERRQLIGELVHPRNGHEPQGAQGSHQEQFPALEASRPRGMQPNGGGANQGPHGAGGQASKKKTQIVLTNPQAARQKHLQSKPGKIKVFFRTRNSMTHFELELRNVKGVGLPTKDHGFLDQDLMQNVVYTYNNKTYSGWYPINDKGQLYNDFQKHKVTFDQPEKKNDENTFDGFPLKFVFLKTGVNKTIFILTPNGSFTNSLIEPKYTQLVDQLRKFKAEPIFSDKEGYYRHGTNTKDQFTIPRLPPETMEFMPIVPRQIPEGEEKIILYVQNPSYKPDHAPAHQEHHEAVFQTAQVRLWDSPNTRATSNLYDRSRIIELQGSKKEEQNGFVKVELRSTSSSKGSRTPRFKWRKL